MPQSEMRVEDLKNYSKNIMELNTSGIPARKLPFTVGTLGILAGKK